MVSKQRVCARVCIGDFKLCLWEGLGDANNFRWSGNWPVRSTRFEFQFIYLKYEFGSISPQRDRPIAVKGTLAGAASFALLCWRHSWAHYTHTHQPDLLNITGIRICLYWFSFLASNITVVIPALAYNCVKIYSCKNYNSPYADVKWGDEKSKLNILEFWNQRWNCVRALWMNWTIPNPSVGGRSVWVCAFAIDNTRSDRNIKKIARLSVRTL